MNKFNRFMHLTAIALFIENLIEGFLILPYNPLYSFVCVLICLFSGCSIMVYNETVRFETERILKGEKQ